MKFDFHGYTCESAIDTLDKHIDNYIAYGIQDKVCTVITGRGKIRNQVIQYLDDSRIGWSYKMGNDGVILVYLTQEE